MTISSDGIERDRGEQLAGYVQMLKARRIVVSLSFVQTLRPKEASVDYDGNGHVDLRHSVPDVLASTANLLKTSGWRAGALCGEATANFEVMSAWNRPELPGSFVGLVGSAGHRAALGGILSLQWIAGSYILLPAMASIGDYRACIGTGAPDENQTAVRLRCEPIKRAIEFAYGGEQWPRSGLG